MAQRNQANEMQQNNGQGSDAGAHQNAPQTSSSGRFFAPHRPSVASPLRVSTHSLQQSSGSDERTPTQSPETSRIDVNAAGQEDGAGQHSRYTSSSSSIGGGASGAPTMASRAQSYLDAWKDGPSSSSSPHALPLHHNPQRHSGATADPSYFSLTPSDPSSLLPESHSTSSASSQLAPTLSSRWATSNTANSRSTLAPAETDVSRGGDYNLSESRKHSFSSATSSGGVLLQGNSNGGATAIAMGAGAVGSIGGGGYASSVDADYHSAPPSRLVSRSPTPVSHTGAGVVRLSSPEIAGSTESDEEDSDFYSSGPSGWGATLFGFGGANTNAGPTAGPFARSDWKRDYHSLGTRRGSKWNEGEPDTMLDYASPRAKARSSAKKYNRYNSFHALASNTAPDVRRRNRRRRQNSSSMPLPLRIVTSLVSKTFRTFFGPIHPLTIIVALCLIAGFVTSVTMLIIYILNPDKEPLPWRTHCLDQTPFPHAYADALAPVNVMVGVLTVDSKYERRNTIRSTYARHTLPTDEHGRPLANVQVKFILGKVRKAHAARVALEMETYNDIVVLDLDETQSARKTHAYLRWAAENATVPFLRPVGPASGNRSASDALLPSASAPGGLANHSPSRQAVGLGDKMASSSSKDDAGEADNEKMRYQVAWKKVDYVVKADDDSFIVLDELERHLRVAPRKMTYWGYLIKSWFMGGEAYALSYDLVQWIAQSPETARTAKGKEDTRTPQWLAMHPNRSKINWVSEHCWIYDHPKGGSPYSHGFLFPDYVEKIKVEARRGLSEQEIAYRGGERRSQSYSTVSKWHQKYVVPRRDLTVEEEVEALVEGGGRWEGTWVRGPDGSSSETWVPYNEIVYQSDDERLWPSATNDLGSSVLASDVGLEPYSGLPIYGPVDRRSFVNTSTSSPAVALPQDHLGSTTVDHKLPRNILNDLKSLPKNFVGYRSDAERAGSTDHSHFASAAPIYRDGARSLPRPTPKDMYGEWASLRARRYLNKPHGGTVVVHYLKKTELWLETALILSGKPKLWTNGAGGLGKEWRMGGSPLIRSDGYISEGRSAPRRMANGHPVPADESGSDHHSQSSPEAPTSKDTKGAADLSSSAVLPSGRLPA